LAAPCGADTFLAKRNMRHPSKPSFRQLSSRQGEGKWGLYATAAGAVQVEANAAYPSRDSHPTSHHFKWAVGRALSDHLLVWVSSGGGELQLGGPFNNAFDSAGTLKVSAGSVLWVPADTWHRYRPASGSGWAEAWVAFNGTVAQQLLGSGAISARPAVLRPQAPGLVERAFKDLTGAILGHVDVPEQLMAAQLFQLLARAVGTHVPNRADAATSVDPVVADAVKLIWTKGKEISTVEALLEEIPVARRTLERAFRKQLGHGIYEEILKCRLERAERLLVERRLSIETIAFEVGFANVRSFRRAFSAANGMSPQAFRTRDTAPTQNA
jgi:AraC-like DNA-binding protein